MEEDKKKIDTDEILKETSETINDVKDQVKGTFKKEELKNNAKETKNFVTGMFKDPIGELKNIAEDSSNATFKFAVILVVIWIIAKVIMRLSYLSLSFSELLSDILSLVKTAVAPIASVLVLSLIIFVLNKKKDKSLTKIITVVTATQLPVVIASVVSILKIVSSRISTITNPFSYICSAISIVLVYFGAKFLLGEEDDKNFIKTFALIQVAYYVAYILISFLEVYI